MQIHQKSINVSRPMVTLNRISKRKLHVTLDSESNSNDFVNQYGDHSHLMSEMH